MLRKFEVEFDEQNIFRAGVGVVPTGHEQRLVSVFLPSGSPYGTKSLSEIPLNNRSKDSSRADVSTPLNDRS